MDEYNSKMFCLKPCFYCRLGIVPCAEDQTQTPPRINFSDTLNHEETYGTDFYSLILFGNFQCIFLV